MHVFYLSNRYKDKQYPGNRFYHLERILLKIELFLKESLFRNKYFKIKLSGYSLLVTSITHEITFRDHVGRSNIVYYYYKESERCFTQLIYTVVSIV